MKFLDLFAGIGGFRLGMEQAGHECVGYVEWDKYARKSYEAIHDTEGEWTAHDITEISDEEIRSLGERNIDVICGGFPCQSFSVAGKRMGFEDTRGTLFFEIARIAKEIKPRYLLLENVKGLLNHDKGNTFSTILRTLDELGYNAEWQVLNSKNFGVPQNRERVFIIGHLRGSGGREVFPVTGTDRQTSLPIEIVAHHKNFRRNLQTFSPNGITETLDSAQGGGRGHYVEIKEATKKGYAIAEEGDSVNFQFPDSKTRRGRVGKQIANTLEASNINQGVVEQVGVQMNRNTIGKETDISHCLMARDYKGFGNQDMTGVIQTSPEYRIRKLTPKECFRLQGFPDAVFDKAQTVNSNSQLYKQAGNSVTVNVVYEIAKRLL